MSFGHNRDTIPTKFTDEEFDILVEEHLVPILSPRGDYEPLEYWRASRITSDEISKFVSKCRGAYTKFGVSLQMILHDIIEKNDRFNIIAHNKIPKKKKTTDIIFSGRCDCPNPRLAQRRVYNSFIQSSFNTKNCDAIKIMDIESQELLTMVALTIVVQDWPAKKKNSPRRVDKPGNEEKAQSIRLVGPEALYFISDGNEQLPEQLSQALTRWGNRHAKILQYHYHRRLSECPPES